MLSLTICLLVLTAAVVDAANPAYVCSFCVIGLGLVEQAAFQVHLERGLQEKCNGNKACELAVQQLVLSIEGKFTQKTVFKCCCCSLTVLFRRFALHCNRQRTSRGFVRGNETMY